MMSEENHIEDDTHGHLSVEMLADYFAGVVDEHLQQLVEEHTAICDECRALARRVRVPAHALLTLTAEAVGEVIHAEQDQRVVATISRAHAMGAAGVTGRRLLDQLANGPRGAEAVLKAASQRIERYERPADDEAPPTGPAEEATDQRRLKGAEIIGSNRVTERLSLLVDTRGHGKVEIEAGKAANELHLRIYDWPAGEPVPVVALVSADPVHADVRVARFQRSTEEPTLRAHFDGLMELAYVLLITAEYDDYTEGV